MESVVCGCCSTAAWSMCGVRINCAGAMLAALCLHVWVHCASSNIAVVLIHFGKNQTKLLVLKWFLPPIIRLNGIHR